MTSSSTSKEGAKRVRETQADKPSPLLVTPTRRAVPEWIGSTPDAKIPDRVKLRIWERCGGRCYLTGKKVMPGDPHDFDHILALCNGGENRESNLALVCRAKHREKTAQDVAVKAKTDRIRMKHLGLKSPSRAWNRNVRKKLDGTVVPR